MTNELLNADLQVRRGGNKERLVARCWVATNYGAECGLNADDYEQFRDAWTKQTFAKLHETFDQFLPAEYQAQKPSTGAGNGRQARQANGLTPAQQKKWNSFQDAPERAERRFLKTVVYFRGVAAGNEELPALIKRLEDAAKACRELIGDRVGLALLWEMGMRTSGDLELYMERRFKL